MTRRLGQHLLPNDDPQPLLPDDASCRASTSPSTPSPSSPLSQLDFCKIQKMATAAGVTGRPHQQALRRLQHLQPDRLRQDVAPLTMANAYRHLRQRRSLLRPHRPRIRHRQPREAVPGTRAGLPADHRPGRCRRSDLRPQERPDQGFRLQHPGQQKSYDIFAKTGTTDGNTKTWTVGATSGIATASWFGSYKGTGPQWVNQNITINGRYYAGVDGADLAGGQWARLMNAAAPQFDPGALRPAAGLHAQRIIGPDGTGARDAGARPAGSARSGTAGSEGPRSAAASSGSPRAAAQGEEALTAGNPAGVGLIRAVP